MRFTILWALSASTSLVAATSYGCYSTGEEFGSEDTEAKAQLLIACSSMFNGTYYQDESVYQCLQLSGGKHLSTSLTFIGSDEMRSIGPAECYNGMSKEVDHCDRGGHVSYGNWKYV